MVNEWFLWMKSIHIPNVLATGKFVDCKMHRVLAEEEGGKTFAIQFRCKDQHTLRSYQRDFAPDLQKMHREKFGSQAVAFRTLLLELEEFKAHG